MPLAFGTVFAKLLKSFGNKFHSLITFNLPSRALVEVSQAPPRPLHNVLATGRHQGILPFDKLAYCASLNLQHPFTLDKITLHSDNITLGDGMLPVSALGLHTAPLDM